MHTSPRSKRLARAASLDLSRTRSGRSRNPGTGLLPRYRIRLSVAVVAVRTSRARTGLSGPFPLVLGRDPATLR